MMGTTVASGNIGIGNTSTTKTPQLPQRKRHNCHNENSTTATTGLTDKSRTANMNSYRRPEDNVIVCPLAALKP